MEREKRNSRERGKIEKGIGDADGWRKRKERSRGKGRKAC